MVIEKTEEEKALIFFDKGYAKGYSDALKDMRDTIQKDIDKGELE